MSRGRILAPLAFLFFFFVGMPAHAQPALPHHEAEVAFDPKNRALEIVDTITVTPAAELSIALADWLRIDGAETRGTSLTVERAGRHWRIKSPGGPFETVTIRASGTVPAMPPRDRRRGARGALADPEEGSFLPSYAVWLPHTGTDQVTYRLRVRIAGPQRAVATGRIIAESASDAEFRGEFAADYPTEPPSVFIGPYSVKEEVVDGVRFRTYFHEEIVGSSDHYIAQSAAFIRLFQDAIGPYPFDDFHIVSAPLPVGLGFPNLTYIGRTIVPLPFMRGRSLAHEVLHNWWGNGVAVDYATGNWSEGLTTYFADYGLARQRGADAAREMRLGWLRDYAALPASGDTPVSSFISKSHQASQIIGYNKVAHVLHMLHDRIGERAFKEAIQAFWREHRLGVAGWTDIQRAFEQASQQELGWFFDQWIRKSGAPEIALADTNVVRQGDRYAVTLSLRQSGAVYRLSVPVVIETEGEVVRRQVPLLSAEETVTLMVDRSPTRVRIDPDFDVFRRLLPGESPQIMRDITLAQRIDAVLLGEDEAFQAAASALVTRLSQKAVPAVEGTLVGPAIVVGADEDIRRYVEDILSADIPPQIAEGSAAAWTHRSADGHPVLLIRAADAAAVGALMRPLPHYGSRSYVTFEGRRARDKGVWKIDNSPLVMDLVPVGE